ncbi:hypothetical protein RRG08_000220 [Elysia crispata]|uniref:Uncharacterized protein n=1 Tax=Elysia crispata TaxID=231223 RepID=A0AAE1E634_9GAST|nr:hypothetical protein RRG08_000220 [Elysia crispata]
MPFGDFCGNVVLGRRTVTGGWVEGGRKGFPRAKVISSRPGHVYDFEGVPRLMVAPLQEGMFPTPDSTFPYSRNVVKLLRFLSQRSFEGGRRPPPSSPRGRHIPRRGIEKATPPLGATILSQRFFEGAKPLNFPPSGGGGHPPEGGDRGN